jgi:DNA-directed RNA polymerase specialized sigma24 family protein
MGRWACFEGTGAEVREESETHQDQALEALFAFMGTIREDWTRRQGLISIRHREGFSQTELAEELRVNPSVVSETLKAARYKLLEFGERAAADMLANLPDKR